jgi:Protein of unknown function (DUF1552)
MMKRDLRFSRRNLLQAIGAGAALLPLLEADRADAACLVNGIKRLYILAWPDGMLSNVSQWATTGDTPATWTLAPFQAALQPHQSDLLLLHGVDYNFIRDQPNPNGGETNGHACFPGMLTGAFYQSLVASTSSDVGGGISVDQYIGNQLQAGGYKGLVSLNLGAFVKSTGRLSWKAAGQPVLPDADPYHVFSTYFAGSLPTPPPTSGMDAGGMPAANPTPKVRKSILDYVLADLNRFSNVVGTDDKARIQSHMQSVRNLELLLAGQAGGGGASVDGGAVTSGTSAACNPPVFSGTKLDINNTSNVPALVKMQMDLAVAAFASDLTRVIVMQIADQGASNLIFTNLGFTAGGPNGNTGDLNGYHSIAHRNDADKVTCDTWFQQQVAYIIGALKGITDPTGKSMLDSSVVTAMNNMRTGTHETTAVPVVMAGSCGGYFKTGRSLALTSTPNNQLLVSLCNAMGFPVQTFGETRYGGELTVLKG